MNVARQGQGPAGPSNPLRAAEETPEERLDRWRKLRDHLHDKGLNEAPPEDLLLKPEPTTRPGVPLVGHYKKIGQESLGKKTYTEILNVVLAIFVGFQVFETLGRLFLDAQQPQGFTVWVVGIGSWLLLVAAIYWVLLRPIKLSTGSLSLSLKELSLSLPDGNRHTQWGAVHSVSVHQRRRWFSRRWPWVGRKAPYVGVEFDDGVVAWLYVCADECEPLADLMTDFLLCARNGGRPLRERADVPEQLDRPA